MYLAEYSGKGVRIAVIDSGVHAAHPHVGGVADGVAIRDDGTLDRDFVDRLGHGTAVAAAIREKAPAAEIVAIKVFWRTLATNVGTLVRAIDEACARGAAIVNLSLGTTDDAHRAELTAAVGRARRAGVFVVSAASDGSGPRLPGDLEQVVPVHLDWSCRREQYAVLPGPRFTIAASGYPRGIPGVPPERNLKGISFAVANATGFVARALEAAPAGNVEQLFGTLAVAARAQQTG